MTARLSFTDLLAFYERHLREQVMPFWTKHCVDEEHGGLNTCVNDDGTLVSTDKYLFSQGRALWTFSALHNHLKGNDSWLPIAGKIAAFVLANGRDRDGRWVYCLHQDGRVADPTPSIYVDAFMILGLTEYARATGNSRALELAIATFERSRPLLNDHSTLPSMPLPVPAGLQAHGPFMVFTLSAHELGVLTQDPKINACALELAERIATRHLKPAHRLLFEFVRPNGELADGDPGKTFVPGHAIESLWFLERVFNHHQRPDRVQLAVDAIRWHLEQGWDDAYGGIFLARHTGGGTPAWHSPDTKVWWPHTEALCALLRAYEVTREPWCLDWHWRVHDYAFRVFPNREHGEWHHNLDRRGRRIPIVAPIPVKDPFHLPRALLHAILTLRRLEGASP